MIVSNIAIRATTTASQTRASRARLTRTRICDAAAALFQERGYSATTMEAIARRAGVAVQTVYFAFRTKGLLFLDVMVRMAHGPHVIGAAEKPVPKFVDLVADERDPQRLLALAIEHSIDFTARVAPLWPFVQLAAEGDPEFTARFEQILERRRSGMRAMFAGLETARALRVTVDQAADTFFLLANPELLSLSTTSLRWATPAYKAWLWRVLARQLLREDRLRAAAATGTSFHKLVSRSRT
jgi:TetR/AcrR family transcriptional regulator, regulator of autoinduction and epiphytic fitness